MNKIASLATVVVLAAMTITLIAKNKYDMRVANNFEAIMATIKVDGLNGSALSNKTVVGDEAETIVSGADNTVVGDEAALGLHEGHFLDARRTTGNYNMTIGYYAGTVLNSEVAGGKSANDYPSNASDFSGPNLAK